MKKYLPHILAVVAVAVILIFVIVPRTSKNGLEQQPRVEEPKQIASPALPTGEPSFLKTYQFGTEHTYSVSAADFNHDGYMDVAVGNFNGQNLIYVNNKDGTYTPSAVAGEPRYTTLLAAEDITGDSWPDLIQINDGASSAVWLNNKDGTFSKVLLPGTERLHSCCTYIAGTTSIANPFTAIAAADFNSDNKKDIVILSDKRIILFTGDNAGNFNPQDIPGIQHPTAVAAGDLDKDGKMDLVIGTDFSKNYVLTNNGDGTFSSTELPDDLYHTTSVVLADIDKDGDLDIVVGNNNQPNLIYYNDGGAFRLTALEQIKENTYEIAAADLNNDGYADIIVGNYNQESHYYLNNKDGTFAKSKFSDASYIRSLVTSDMNNDGATDIIVARDNQPSQIYLNELK